MPFRRVDTLASTVCSLEWPDHKFYSQAVIFLAVYIRTTCSTISYCAVCINSVTNNVN